MPTSGGSCLPEDDVYTLDGRQKKALHAALRNAFPRPAALERLVEFHLDEHLAVIAGEGALDDVIFRVIAWAEAQGRLDALVNGARVEVPGNPQLIAFERTIVEARDARPQDVPLRQFAERVQLAPSVPDEPDLEKRVFRAGFSDIAQWRARLGQAELAVCRIESPAWRALGTGFLVRARPRDDQPSRGGGAGVAGDAAVARALRLQALARRVAPAGGRDVRPGARLARHEQSRRATRFRSAAARHARRPEADRRHGQRAPARLDHAAVA